MVTTLASLERAGVDISSAEFINGIRSVTDTMNAVEKRNFIAKCIVDWAKRNKA